MQNINNVGNYAPMEMTQLMAADSGSFKTNREYKDRLFKAIFGRDSEQSKRWRLDLYNALNGTNYTDPDALSLTTIENVIYITMKNDISFLIGSQMNLFEQQSSFNPNMPLRGLMYFAQLYQMYLSKQEKDLFGTTLVKIPTPSFIVFYNGNRKLPDVSYQKLSDAFEPTESGEGFEWTAKVLNIGGEHNKELHKKCRALYDYTSYVNQVKKNLRKKQPVREAVEEALEYAIRENLLDGFFKNQKMEVLNMSLTEFDQEQYDRNRRREGIDEGVLLGKLEAARNLLKMELLTHEQIAQAVKLSLEEIEKLAAEPAVQRT